MNEKLLVLTLAAAAEIYGQQRPPRTEPKPARKTVPEKSAKWESPQRVDRKVEEPRARGDKWENGQYKDRFNQAANGEARSTTDRTTRDTETRRSVTPTEKRDKWANGQQKEGFNRAARGDVEANSKDAQGRSGKSSGGAAPPPGPSPRP